MDHLGDMDHRMVRTGPKSRRIESQEVKTRSVAVDQFPVAKESHNQAEMTFRFDFHFNNFLNTEAGMKLYPLLYPSIDVESCRTEVKHLNLFIVRNGCRITELLHNDPTHKEARRRFYHTEQVTRNLQWSPKGSYLLAMGKRTITLCGGDGLFGLLPPIMRFRHDMVERVDFSPGEKYLVGYSRPEPSNTEELWLKIFDVRTGRLVTGVDGHVAADWPVIRWAGGKDDKYFATLSKNNVYVYETETFKVLGNKPVDVDDDVVDISWSPTESILALWKRSEVTVTKIVLVRIPDKKKLIQKDIINLNASSDCKMFWQSNGKYLAVQVDRHTYSVFELATFEDKQADTLFWSPRGKNIVLADLKDGCLEFFDVDKLVTRNSAKHQMVTVIAWDPTGRYVATAVTISGEISKESDPEIDGFKMWSLHGEPLYSVPSEDYRLLQLEWRPYGGIIDDKMLENPASDEEDSEYQTSDEEDSEYQTSDEEDLSSG